MEGTSLVVEYTRGKWFVMGSDADNWGQLRGPHDVLNIGCVIGLPEEQVLFRDAINSFNSQLP